jgi:hypothetical protein
MIDTQIQQHELIEDNEDYLTSGEFTKIHFKFGLPVFISDLIQYLTGKLLHNSPQNIEEEADKEKAKLMNLIPVGEREICPGPFFDSELDTVRTGMSQQHYAQFLSIFQKFLNYYPDEKKLKD